MEELRLGKITTTELAEWFNTTAKNLSKHKKDYLKKLEPYCAFEPFHGGINVTQIYKSIYVKNKTYMIAEEEFDKEWSASGLDTCSNVANKICEKRCEELNVQPATVAKHLSQVRNTKYGKPFSEKGGPEGHCIYILCKKDDNGQPIFLTEEEEAIKKKLLKKWLGNADEKTLLVKELISKGELSKEEAWSYYSDIINLPRAYTGFMGDFKAETGVQLIRGTLIDKELKFIEDDNVFIFD